MEDLLKQLLVENSIAESKTTTNIISKLIDNTRIIGLANSISATKKQILEIFNMYKQSEDFKEKHIAIDNANAKREYEYFFNMEDFPDLVITKIVNLDSTGLQFDAKKNRIYGTPPVACNADLHVMFFHKSDENLTEDAKVIPFIVNADPKDLWKNIPSNKDIIYAKEDELSLKANFLDKKIVVASKRGRSHAHEGTSRDDHFSVAKLPDDWALVAVADGAGSAKYARQGSKIATEHLQEYFSNEEVLRNLSSFVTLYQNSENLLVNPESVEDAVSQENKVVSDSDISNYSADVKQDLEQANLSSTQNIDEVKETLAANEGDNSNDGDNTPPDNSNLARDPKIDAKSSIVNVLYKSVRSVFQKLQDFSSHENMTLKDLNTTLIFALAKKFDFGYTILTFGVGDCPINILSKDEQTIELLNYMDVGEFGGGTRFVTMPEIYSNPNMGSRFALNFYKDFSKLFLMTDGIYDPKFITENKLEDFEAWKNFLDDLDGKNEDGAKVDFSDDENVDRQLMTWMDFWSKGNHDDRTLAIIY